MGNPWLLLHWKYYFTWSKPVKKELKFETGVWETKIQTETFVMEWREYKLAKTAKQEMCSCALLEILTFLKCGSKAYLL